MRIFQKEGKTMKRLTIFLSTLLTLIWTAPMLAQPSPEVREKRFQRIQERFDKNGDGVLSEEERAAFRNARERRHQKILERYDKDGDGRLSDEERAAAKKERNKDPKHPALVGPHTGS
jgi:Ca2+-binding EF-hand superfamily protein